MTRVLLVTHYYPHHRSGIERIAWELARRLPRHGMAVTWAATAAPELPAADGLRCLPAAGWNVAEDRLGFPYPVWSPAALVRLARAARASDVVFVQDSLYLGNAVAAAAAGGVPVVVTQHIGLVPYQSPVLRRLMSAANRTIGRWVLGRADRVAVYNRQVEGYFARFVRFRSPPQFIPNGVDTDVFRPPADRAAVRAGLGWPADRPVLLFVGRFVEKKGLAVLRKVAASLPESDFVFAGRGPIDPAQWQLRNVRVAGSLGADQLVPLYQAADLLVLPSVGEGFPLVVQEAMACGTPALISDETAAGYPGAAEWAVVAKPEPVSVTGAIKTALSDPAGLARRRERVATLARSMWDWDQCAAAYAKMFRELV